jgi:hypothetical protein
VNDNGWRQRRAGRRGVVSRRAFYWSSEAYRPHNDERRYPQVMLPFGVLSNLLVRGPRLLQRIDGEPIAPSSSK